MHAKVVGEKVNKEPQLVLFGLTSGKRSLTRIGSVFLADALYLLCLDKPMKRPAAEHMPPDRKIRLVLAERAKFYLHGR